MGTFLKKFRIWVFPKQYPHFDFFQIIFLNSEITQTAPPSLFHRPHCLRIPHFSVLPPLLLSPILSSSPVARLSFFSHVTRSSPSSSSPLFPGRLPSPPLPFSSSLLPCRLLPSPFLPFPRSAAGGEWVAMSGDRFGGGEG